MNIHINGAEKQGEESSGGSAIHIIVAKYEDGFLSRNCRKDSHYCLIHVLHEKGIMKALDIRIEKVFGIIPIFYSSETHDPCNGSGYTKSLCNFCYTVFINCFESPFLFNHKKFEAGS